MKKYIDVQDGYLSNLADDWLLKINSKLLSSDAKIVYLILKKIQDKWFTCNTDSHSWEMITGLSFKRVKECLKELEAFGLVENYFSPLQVKQYKKTFDTFLLDHYLMQGRYKVLEQCPHDEISINEPLNEEILLNNDRNYQTIADFRKTIDHLLKKDK